MAGTVIREVTLCCAMASRAALASNLGINTWHAPTMSIASADDKPPMWQSGAVCKYTCNNHRIIYIKLIQFSYLRFNFADSTLNLNHKISDSHAFDIT